MDQSRFIRGLLSDPVDPQLPQYVPENDFGPRAYGLLNQLLPDPYEAVGDAIRQYRGGDAVGAFETMLGSIPQTGMFLGRNAKTADLGKLAQAEKMAAEGAPREQIWGDTGWFQGVDKKWRFEIPDNKSFANANRDAEDVGSFLKHDDLYEAYPSASELAFRWTRNPKAGYNGVFYPHPQYRHGGRIEVAAQKDAGSVLLHELQHYVDNFEGNAAGSDMLPVKRGTPEWDIYKENPAINIQPLDKNTFSALNGGDGASSKAYDNYLALVKKENKARDAEARKKASQEGYRRDASEVLARTTQARIDMNAAERKSRYPWLDYDVPEEKQIVRGLLGR